jgi:hypothetical protein
LTAFASGPYKGKLLNFEACTRVSPVIRVVITYCFAGKIQELQTRLKEEN